MEDVSKVATVIDSHKIAIKLSKKDAENIVAGQTVRVVAKVIDIPDPDNEDKSLGSYSIYKDSLEVTEIHDNFAIATKYYHKKSVPFPIMGTKELGTIDATHEEVSDYGKKISAGDLVEFD